jgi:hypothetical protein
MVMPKRKYVRQPAIKGGRLRSSTGFEKSVHDAVRRSAQRFGVTVPFYLTVLAAEAEGIDLDKAYTNAIPKRVSLRLVKAS